MELDVRKLNQKIWNRFIEETYPLLREYEFTDIPADSDKFVVIVEPREHPHLEYVLRNAMHFLGPEWGLQIFTGQNNKSFVEKIVKQWEKVHIGHINTNDLSSKDYNQLKKSVEFWSYLKGKHILWIETDCLLCHNNIDEFLKYDYVGAPWNSNMALSEKVRVGNGGISLRRKNAMIEIASTCNQDARIFPQEDLFYAVNMNLQSEKFCLPSLDHAKKFAVESVYYPTPFSLHKSWKYLSTELLELLLQTIKYQ